MSEEKQIEKVDDDKVFALAQRKAKALAASSLIPDTFKGNIPNVMLAMEIAERIGANTFAVMQHLYVVHGKPAFDATFLISTVNACGRFSPIRYRFSGKEGSDDWSCRAYAVDKQTGEECVGPAVSVKMAKAEEWWSKKGSKWPTLTELMLCYRAAAFWTRIYAPELSLGMHTVDEVDDYNGPKKITVSSLTEVTKILEDKKQTAEPDSAPNPETAKDPVIAVESTNSFSAKDELFSVMIERHGENSNDELRTLCRKHGCTMATLTEEQASMLLDVLANK